MEFCLNKLDTKELPENKETPEILEKTTPHLPLAAGVTWHGGREGSPSADLYIGKLGMSKTSNGGLNRKKAQGSRNQPAYSYSKEVQKARSCSLSIVLSRKVNCGVG